MPQLTSSKFDIHSGKPSSRQMLQKSSYLTKSSNKKRSKKKDDDNAGSPLNVKVHGEVDTDPLAVDLVLPVPDDPVADREVPGHASKLEMRLD